MKKITEISCSLFDHVESHLGGPVLFLDEAAGEPVLDAALHGQEEGPRVEHDVALHGDAVHGQLAGPHGVGVVALAVSHTFRRS